MSIWYEKKNIKWKGSFMDGVSGTETDMNKETRVRYREISEVRFGVKKNLTKTKKRKVASVLPEKGTWFEIRERRKVYTWRRRKR